MASWLWVGVQGAGNGTQRSVARGNGVCYPATMKKIVVVEDSDDLRELVLEVLRDAGYDAVGAQHGQEALQVLQSLADEPCLILLDLMMPIMDGHAFLNIVNQHHHLAALPIVVVTATGKGPTLGGRRVVKKPVSPAALRQVVAEYCGPA